MRRFQSQIWAWCTLILLAISFQPASAAEFDSKEVKRLTAANFDSFIANSEVSLHFSPHSACQLSVWLLCLRGPYLDAQGHVDTRSRSVPCPCLRFAWHWMQGDNLEGNESCPGRVSASLSTLESACSR